MQQQKQTQKPAGNDFAKKYSVHIPSHTAEIHDCTLGIPYSGDASYGLAAAFRSENINAEVMTPSCDQKTYEYADRFVTTQTCEPFRIQTGDILSWLEIKSAQGHPPDKLAVFEPTAGGPCRFGQYAEIIRYFLNDAGYENTRIISPSASNDYMEMQLPLLQTAKVLRLATNALYAFDILYNALLRVRPYEKKQETANDTEYTPAENIYQQAIAEICDDIENGGKNLLSIIKKTARNLESLEFDRSQRYPVAIINGEFFMRTHPGANHNIAKVLESEFNRPLETLLAPSMEWFHYVNRSRLAEAWHEKQWKDFGLGLIKKLYMDYKESRFWEPFSELLEGREPHDPMQYVNALEEVAAYHRDIQGESPISIGMTYLFMNHHFTPKKGAVISGICHIGPHQCMQETVATSVSQALIRQKQAHAESPHDKIIPYVDIVFTDEPEPQWRPKLASFVYQCYTKKDMITKNDIRSNSRKD